MENLIPDKLEALLVEDNPGDSLLIEENISSGSTGKITISKASTLSEALKILKDRKFDLILLDLGLPDSDGINTFIKIRDFNPDLPVIIMTGNDSVDLAAKCISQGAHDYLVKGFKAGCLANTIYNSVVRDTVTKRLLTSYKNFEKTFSDSKDCIFICDDLFRVVWNNSVADAVKENIDFSKIEIKDLSVEKLYSINGIDLYFEVTKSKIDWYGKDYTLFSFRDVTSKNQYKSRLIKANNILFTIRNINRAIIRKKDELTLVRELAGILCKTPGFNGVILVTYGINGNPQYIENAGNILELQEEISKIGKIGEIISTSLKSEKQTEIATCGGVTGTKYRVQNHIIELVHGCSNVGLLGLSLEEELNESDDAHLLLEELSADIAHGIWALRTNEEKQRSLLRFETLFRNSINPIFRLDRNFKMIEANNSFYSYLKGKPEPESSINAYIQNSDLDRFKECLEKDTTPFEIDFLFEGDVRNFLVSAAPFNCGEENGWYCIVQDLTERKRMEALLAQTDRLSSMGMLAAGVAHEINNPLSYIIYNLTTLKEEIPEILNIIGEYIRSEETPDVEKYCQRIKRIVTTESIGDINERLKDSLDGVNKIKDISRGLGTFSKVDSSDLTQMGVNHVIDSAINMAYNEIKYRARIEKNYQSCQSVKASEGRLSQVILNLVINAAHSIPEGHASRNLIRVASWDSEKSVFIEVTDTGSGIEKDKLKRIFEPFYTTKPRGLGSGLGLYISKDIIEKFNGSISVISSPGSGTSFLIELPAIHEIQVVKGKTSESKLLVSRTLKILIIDDEAIIRTLLKRMLKEHNTNEAASGTHAIQILNSDSEYDLIFCDMMMPQMSGVEFHEWIMIEKPHLASRIIFISGGIFSSRVQEYLQINNLRRLNKPFDSDSISEIIKEFSMTESS